MAFCISSIVPSEMRAHCFSSGGKSRPTITPLAAHASRNCRRRHRLADVGEDEVGLRIGRTVKPRSASALTVKSLTAVLRATLVLDVLRDP